MDVLPVIPEAVSNFVIPGGASERRYAGFLTIFFKKMFKQAISF